MNCKPGDLALIVKARVPENIGKMVRCLEIAPPGTDNMRQDIGPLWLTDRMTPTALGVLNPYVHDCNLMPIRPRPDEVERDCAQTVRANDVQDR